MNQTIPMAGKICKISIFSGNRPPITIVVVVVPQKLFSIWGPPHSVAIRPENDKE